MSENIRISMFEVVGSPLCVATSDGQKVYDRLTEALKADRAVTLSCQNVTTMIPAFMNAAIGQLYETFSEEQIQSLLKVEDIEPNDRRMLESVVKIAKLSFKEPRRFDQVVRGKLDPVVREILGDDEDDE